MRATVLRTYDNQRVLIPNATLFVDKITVITAHEKRRLAFPLTIGTATTSARCAGSSSRR
ncbi:hypothetical protein SAMN04487843_12620 [Methylobacterium sp. ap11]|uniref:mechanosensitive ion channel family protein n=1 Tax=Methylobacterium sp. ap11 TaxID=1761799 RepID=UPI0008C5B1D8|nr:mechanosensitive ion channel family protein [Methylobacterium sp. ap11]SEP48043.1 hypothetical protein SAMN04487843_12620 [Methylobacterium sp. ap11]